MSEPTENPFPGTSAPSGVTCAQCGVVWSLDARESPCPMAPEQGVAGRHLFAQGVTAPEVERLRRIERVARAVVDSARMWRDRDHAFIRVDDAPITDLRAALESK